MKKEYSAGGIVFRKKDSGYQILFIRDPYEKWSFPKGHIESGESSNRAALREIAEETGINESSLRILKELGKTNYKFWDGVKRIHKYVDFYLVEANGNINIKPQLEEKISDVRWVDIDRALEFSEYKNVGGLLEIAIKNILDK